MLLICPTYQTASPTLNIPRTLAYSWTDSSNTMPTFNETAAISHNLLGSVIEVKSRMVVYKFASTALLN
jgi:hypothetical protein